MNKTIEELYLVYVNDFLTVGMFAEYHELSIQEATTIINVGKRLNNKRGS